MSREHIITEALFNNETIGVKGLPWCRERRVFISPGSYAANILCRKHNSDLSPVDEAATKAFDDVRTAVAVHDQRKASLANAKDAPVSWDVTDYVIDGGLLERWFLKTLINMEVIGGQHLPLGKCGLADEIPRELVDIAFGEGKFTARAGLYIAGIEGEVLRVAERVRYVSWIDDAPERSFVTGGAFVFHCLRFALSLQPEGIPPLLPGPDGDIRLIRHARAINLQLHGHESQRLLFGWSE